MVLRIQKSRGLDLETYGPRAWDTLHAFAHSSEFREREWLALLESVAALLPCRRCGAHFSEAVRTRFASGIVSKEELIAGLNDIHNEVNRRRSKRVYSLEEHFQAFHNPHLEVVGRLDVLLVVLVAAVSVSVLASNLKRSRCRVLS